jgi:dynein light chain LC8-type
MMCLPDDPLRYPGAWHVVVGTSFGSYVTHEVSSIIYFFVGAVGFLVFKHG